MPTEWSDARLSLAEGEEISRGIAVGNSARKIVWVSKNLSESCHQPILVTEAAKPVSSSEASEAPANDEHPIETFPADGTDKTLGNRIGPWCKANSVAASSDVSDLVAGLDEIEGSPAELR